MVAECPGHALDRLLGRMVGDRVIARAGSPVDRRDFPQRRLFAIADPVGGGPLADGEPGWLMLPVIGTPAEDQRLFGPDDLRADLEPGRLETLGDDGGMETAVPDIGDIAGQEGERLAPVSPVVVGNSAEAIVRARREVSPPRGVIADAVGD